MKKMMILLIFGLICTPQLRAESLDNTPALEAPLLLEKETLENKQLACGGQFVYGSVGSIGGYPTAGGGYRIQHGYHGLDISGKCLPGVTAETKARCLLYPWQHGMYVGAGFGYLWEAEVLHSGSPSFDATLGYQWKTKKGRSLFLEVDGTVPFKNPAPCSRVWPGLTLGFGF